MPTVTILENEATSLAGTSTASASTTWSSGPLTLTVQFDSTSNSYTLTAPSGSETFSQADLGVSNIAGQTVYQQVNGDKLTLVTAVPKGGSGNPPPQQLSYVTLGDWQTSSGGDTNYATFDFGTPTPASGVPRTGEAAYNADLIAYLGVPGQDTKSLTGSGVFEADFLSGLVKADFSPLETDLTSGSGLVGGSIVLVANGVLSSTDETFSGQVLFSDDNGTNYTGPFSGRLYGPAGQEVGAGFSASNPNGGALSGTFVGIQTGSAPDENLSLTNVYAQQVFYSPTVEFQSLGGAYHGIADLILYPNGNISFSGATSDTQGTTLTPADIVTSTLANFTTYKTTVNTVPIEFDKYNVGPGNTELALTYMDFGIWRQDATIPPQSYELTDYTVWGIQTPAGVLERLTGTGQYTGVAYGTAVTSAGQYDLTGTSSLAVNFTAQSLTGSMSLTGALEGSGSANDFGAFGFTGSILPGGLEAQTAALQVTQGGNDVGRLDLQFFGPSAQEAGGPFQVQLNNGQPNQTNIAGVIAVKNH